MSLAQSIKKLKTYSFMDGCRKVIYFLRGFFFKMLHFIRKIKALFFIKCWIENILGKVYFISVCNNVTIGTKATLYPYCIFEVSENARLTIGDNFTLSYGSLIACNYSLKIGDFVMIGEYSSVRDTTHKHEYSSIPYCQQEDESSEIIIGNNVWIGRGCLILPGSVIEDGVIIAAHSVVKGRLKSYCMYGGTPARIIKEMDKSEKDDSL